MNFDLIAAVKAAKPGEVISVPPGDYPAVTLSRVKGLTIRGEDATFAGLTLSACERVTVEGLSVRLQPTEKTVSSTAAVRVVQSSGVVLRRLNARCGLAVAGLPQDTPPTVSRTAYGDAIIGLPIGRALTLDGCEDVTVEGCDFGESHKGIVLNNCRGVRIVGNTVHDTRTGQITAAGISDAVIEANRLRNARPWNFGAKGDHGDFIHVWTTAARPACTGLVIAGNQIDQGEGYPILGVLLEDNGGGGFPDAKVIRNVILNGNSQGVAVSNFRGRIEGNVLLQSSGRPEDAPSFRLRAGSETAVVTGNVCADVHRDLAKRGDAGNTILIRRADAGALTMVRAD